MVEKSLSVVLDSLDSGEKPDPSALSQLQASLASGLENSPEVNGYDRSRRRQSTAGASTSRYSQPPNEGFGEGRSPSSSSDVPDLVGGTGEGRSAKRARHASTTSLAFNESPVMGGNLAISPHSTSTGGAPGSAQIPQLALPMVGAPHPGTSPTGANGGAAQQQLHPSPSNPSPGSQQGQQTAPSLAMLADASLAAQIDGRSKLTGLDSSFNLSTVTYALQRNHDRLGAPTGEEDCGRTPAVLSKGIVTPELAVELFTMCANSSFSFDDDSKS